MIVYFAAQFARNGGTIRLQTYVAMCHVFQMFPHHPCTLASFYELRKFIYEATSGAQIESEMRIVDGQGRIQEDPLDLDKYPITITKEEVHFLLSQIYLTIALEAHGSRSLTTLRIDEFSQQIEILEYSTIITITQPFTHP